MSRLVHLIDETTQTIGFLRLADEVDLDQLIERFRKTLDLNVHWHWPRDLPTHGACLLAYTLERCHWTLTPEMLRWPLDPKNLLYRWLLTQPGIEAVTYETKRI